VEIVEGEGEVFVVKYGASHYNEWGLYGVVILYREGWRRGSSKLLWDLLLCLHFLPTAKITKDALQNRPGFFGAVCTIRTQRRCFIVLFSSLTSSVSVLLATVRLIAYTSRD